MEDIEEPTTDGSGQDVVLVAAGAWADPPQCQKHCQRRTHAKEVFHLRDKEEKTLRKESLVLTVSNCLMLEIVIYRNYV